MKFGAKSYGFTTIEVLLALSIGMMCLPIFFQSFQLLNFDQTTDVEWMEDVMGIEQLRMYLACGNIEDVSENQLTFSKGDSYTLSKVNGQLTLQPGTLVFVTDVDSVKFYLENDRVCMKLRKGKQVYDVWLGFQ